MQPKEIEAQAARFREEYRRIKQEIAKAIVGHEAVVDGVLTGIFTGGNCLLEGVPGLGKTHLIRTLSRVLDLEFSRIQFTPDLMPADIIGTNVVVEHEGGGREFQFRKGPVFAQLVLADEINRATPKTQSAMLEAMQEHRVTSGGTTYELPQPFCVLATQNPIEQEGTYPLPEAQLDRFLFKLLVGYSSRAELAEIIDRTTGKETPEPQRIMGAEDILRWRGLVRELIVAPHVKDYAIRLVLATHAEGEFAVEAVNRYAAFGASPRGAQALILAGKFRALLDGRYSVSFNDIRSVALPALRHRVLLNFEGEADGVSTDRIVEAILDEVPTTVKGEALQRA
ncbi:MAG: MoxR family ATPase [Planctomycetota bacterium]|nr:MAG: MoxR family ATPase [Planctomycetota bacterium]